MPVPPVCNKCGMYFKTVSRYECNTCEKPIDKIREELANALARSEDRNEVLQRELAEAKEAINQLRKDNAKLAENSRHDWEARRQAEQARDSWHKQAAKNYRDLAAARAEAGRLREQSEKLSGLGSWFEVVLDTKVEHRGYADPSGHPHGGGVVVIPEWEARRHLDEIRAALATPAADVAYAPDDEVREVGRRMMDIHRETFQRLADNDASGEYVPPKPPPLKPVTIMDGRIMDAGGEELR